MDLEQTDVVDVTTEGDQEVADELSIEETSIEIADELLIEEISIDGMCGVY